MKRVLPVVLLLAGILLAAPAVLAQAPRQDVIWARTTTETITLDGVLDEASWSAAESKTIRFGIDNDIPGSGWKIEGGVLPTDSTRAVLRFLVKDNQLYLGADVFDKSVGGSVDFNRFDGFLMGLIDRANANAPKPVSEYFYAWWYAEGTDPQPPGQSPAFIGRWAEWPPGTPRTVDQIAAWDAVTVVHGQSNSDAVLDTGYTVEMRFDLGVMGYDVTQAGGDVVEWNISIYDCDWYWPLDAFKLAYNRVWWQGPWGNTSWYHQVRIHARPDVTVDTGVLPYVGPEVVIGEAVGYAAPVIDGDLSDPVWADVPSFDIRYGDDALRETYPGMGPSRSGQFQPPVNGGLAAVLDPGDATVKMFFQDSTLYVGFDVRDLVVQDHPAFDRWDGALVTINDVTLRNPDNVLLPRRLAFHVASDGSATPEDYLATLVLEGSAEVALDLKAGTTVDTLGLSPDTGYTAEMKVELTRLGYTPDLGDGTLFIGITLLDGDSFTPYTDSYGTRTWWFREYEGQCCPAWAHLGRGTPVTGIGDDTAPTPVAFRLLGSFPNPAARSTIRFSLPAAGDVLLEVFDVAGRRVAVRPLGVMEPGVHDAAFDASDRAAGVYFYRLRIFDPGTRSLEAVLNGRMVVAR